MEKTKYFTEDNIQKHSDDLLKKLATNIDLHTDKFKLEKSALLILDMQRFFFDNNSHAFMPSGQAIIKPILKLADLFQKNNRPIIATKHINNLDNAKMMDVWWRDIITEDSEFSDLIPEIQKINITNHIIKNQYDAFYKTNLDDLLQKNNIEQVIITGVITHLCCETTVRSAFVHGYNTFFPIDSSATYNKDIHVASLINLGHGFANIVTCESLINQYNEHH